MKKIIKNFLIFLFCISIVCSIWNLLVDNSKELIINKENNSSELMKYISDEYDNPEEITRIKLKVLLGEGELSLYKNFIIKKETKIIRESDPLFDYVCEYGDSNIPKYKYIAIIVISCVGIFVSQRYLKDDET